MKKGKITITITIGLMSFVLSTLMFRQFKTISSTNILELENMREDQLNGEIIALKAKYEEAKVKLEGNNEKIEEYKKTINTEKEAATLLEQELKESKDLLGKNDISGPGIVVTLEDTRNARILPEDLLVLINHLNSAGAEAISINNQRIVYDSYIVDINSKFLRVNGQVINSPYVVKAIGNTTYLESAISQKNIGYVDDKLSEGKEIKVEQQKQINIGKYTGNLNFEYVKEEGK